METARSIELMKEHILKLIMVLFQLLYALTYLGVIVALTYTFFVTKDPSRLIYIAMALVMVYIYGLKPEPKYENKTAQKSGCETCGHNCCNGPVAKRFTDSGFN